MVEEESPSSDHFRRGGGGGGGGLRALIEPRCLSPFALNDGGDGGLVVGWRFSYSKLPPQRLIKLSVIKLDGSLFDVQIAKDGTVAELKRAVEEVFTASPKEGYGQISWCHVWGHFCLCYQGQKLVNDKACIRNFGIRDGDQLHFIRHLSIDHSPLNRSKSQTCKRYLGSQMKANDAREKEQIAHRDDNNQNHEDSFSKSCSSEAPDELPVPECKLADLLRGWLSYAGLWGVSRNGSENRSRRPSRFSLKRLGGRPKMIQL